MGLSTFPAAGGGVTQKVSEFTSTGTFTVPTNCTSISLLIYGGGGGAGGNYVHATNYWAVSGSGGGGTYFHGDVPVDAGTTYTVTIGAGGAGGTTAGTSGALGIDSTFGSLATGYGGGGGGGWAGAIVYGTLRGSGGGSTGEQDTYWGRVGGGGNGHAERNADGADTVLGTKGTTTTLYGSGGFGADLGHHRAGPGYLGRGGGGGAGGIYITDAAWQTVPSIGIHGGAPGRRQGTGYSADANYAGGGGGEAHNGTVDSFAGGAGGSGFARITYWS